MRRKILIIARTAGSLIESASVTVDSLVPPELALMAAGDALDRLQLLDQPLLERLERTRRDDGSLRFVARLKDDSVSDPLSGGAERIIALPSATGPGRW